MILPSPAERRQILSQTPKTKNLVVCPNCRKTVLPRLFVYRREPDHTACPHCGKTLRSFENSSRLGDKILLRISVVSGALYLLSVVI